MGHVKHGLLWHLACWGSSVGIVAMLGRIVFHIPDAPLLYAVIGTLVVTIVRYWWSARNGAS